MSPDDVLGIDALLDDTELETRRRVRSFVEESMRPHVAQWFEDARFPVEIVPELGRRGLLGMHLTGYGCPGRSAVEYGLALAEIEAADSGLRTFVSVQGSLAMSAIEKFGTDEQKKEWLPQLAAGVAIGCFALTEPASGSDPGGMTTFARRDGEDWVITGTKRWIGLASVAQIAVVWAQTDDGIRGFLVPTSAPGFTAGVIDSKLSMRASIQCDVELRDVRVSDSARLVGAEGLRGPLSCLNEARYGIVWGVMGAARDCYLSALAYAHDRRQYGKPLVAFQLTQQKLVEMVVEIEKGFLLALHLGRRKDRGELRPEQISVGKLSNVRGAIAIARSARELLGGNGITLTHSPMRHAVNLESVRTYEGTDDIHTLAIGRAITGVSAFR